MIYIGRRRRERTVWTFYRGGNEIVEVQVPRLLWDWVNDWRWRRHLARHPELIGLTPPRVGWRVSRDSGGRLNGSS